jgi:hypothetical protein
MVLMFCSGIPFWWWAPTPLNVNFWWWFEHSVLNALDANVPLLEWYAPMMIPSLIASHSSAHLLAIVSAAVVESWGKLKI